jgi:hypothetical protein
MLNAWDAHVPLDPPRFHGCRVLYARHSCHGHCLVPCPHGRFRELYSKTMVNSIYPCQRDAIEMVDKLCMTGAVPKGVVAMNENGYFIQYVIMFQLFPQDSSDSIFSDGWMTSFIISFAVFLRTASFSFSLN